MWLLYAFAGPIAWAASTHIDKYILERYFKRGSVAVSMVFTAIIGLIMLPFIAAFVPGVFAYSLNEVLVMIVSGALYMAGLLFYLYALQSEEATIIGMLSPGVPILTYALAFVFLGERLTGIQIVGGALVVAGAFVASLRLGGGKARFRKRPALMMAFAIFCIALSSVIFKFFAVAESFWPATFWTYAGETIFGAGILMFASERKILARLVRSNPGALLTVNAVNELVNLAGSLASRFAFVLAPLALVQAVTSTTPLFVFFFAVLLTYAMPKFGREDFTRQVLFQKLAAAALVVLGVWLAG
jgi:uncharacterized membrane protein